MTNIPYVREAITTDVSKAAFFSWGRSVGVKHDVTHELVMPGPRAYPKGDKPEIFESVILSVKAGHLLATHVRDLKGVLDREKAAIGVLISMQEPTTLMRTEAVTAGFYESELWRRKYPKMQLLTVAELLAGKGIDMPPIKQVNRTFKRAARAEGKKGEAESLPLG